MRKRNSTSRMLTLSRKVTTRSQRNDDFLYCDRMTMVLISKVVRWCLQGVEI